MRPEHPGKSPVPSRQERFREDPLDWTSFLGRRAFDLAAIARAWKIALPPLERLARRYMVDRADPEIHGPRREREDKLVMGLNVVRAAFRAYDRGSPAVRDAIVRLFLRKYLTPPEKRGARRRFLERYGTIPPAFLTISPEGTCNLSCRDCYAASIRGGLPRLSAGEFSWVLERKEEEWGSWFTVVSGGEPFLWRDGDVDLVEMARLHPSQYFLVYTNGTLLDRDLARRLGEVGNITPAISVEGFERETDARRGHGVHRRILAAMENLREAGVPFGISVTANRDNARLLLSDEFIDFWFERQGALYMWLFHYMPIGRGIEVERQVPPDVRAWMWEREQELVHRRRLFVVDFWNMGPVSSGCIAAGRGGGYLYIDWHGRIHPCVFVPYWTERVQDLAAAGRPLTDALSSDFFRRIRDWQREYSWRRPPAERGNEIRPCPIRDHHRVLRRIVRESGANPGTAAAAEALHDEAYVEGMARYDEAVAAALDPIWEAHYRDP